MDAVKPTAQSALPSMLHAANLNPVARPWSGSAVTAAAVAAAGDAALLYVLLRAGVSADTAGMLSLLTATLCLLVLRSLAGEANASLLLLMRAGRIAVVAWLTVFLRAGILAWMLRIPGCPLFVTAAVSAIVAGVFLHMAFTLEPTGAPGSR